MHQDPNAANLQLLIDMSMDFARAIHAAGTATTEPPTPEQVAALDRTARSVRASVQLLRRLAEPPTALTRRAFARARIVRVLDNNIRREHGYTPHAEALRAEVVERMEDPALSRALDHEITFRTVGDIIGDHLDDMQLATFDPEKPKTRRTPADLRDLLKRAADPHPPPWAP